jgi:glycosyltransferase involved in cell wall biosynthesis
VYNGLNYPYRPMPRAEATDVFSQALKRQSVRWPQSSPTAAGSAFKFLFSIGGAQWYKNRAGLLDIYAELYQRLKVLTPLVMVGPALEPELAAQAAITKIADRIVHIPGLTNEELRAAYSLADGLIFPSWEEGFGWPIAEAQACGCPVFTSNRPPMTEVGGDAACYFDPGSPKDAVEKIVQGLGENETLRARGLQLSERWSADRMIEGYLRIYDEIRARTDSAAPLSTAT